MKKTGFGYLMMELAKDTNTDNINKVQIEGAVTCRNVAYNAKTNTEDSNCIKLSKREEKIGPLF